MKPKKPKARVMPCIIKRGIPVCVSEPGTNLQYLTVTGETVSTVAVLPCATKKQAQQIVRFFNKTEEERVEEMAEEMHTDWRAAHGVPGCERWEMIFENQKEPYRRSARAIHALIFGGTEK